MRLLRLFLTFTLFLIATQGAAAQSWSYIYIQGDKETPFYVKLEGEMLPRYGKNYCIIPQLEAGRIELQILFQQNLYPPQTFKILVPERSHRGFLLVKEDKAFALYDIQQKFYLMPGDAGEDHLPEILPVASRSSSSTTAEKHEITNNDGPQFLDNLVLENNHRKAPSQSKTNEVKETSRPETEVANIMELTAVEEETTVQNADEHPLSEEAWVAPSVPSGEIPGEQIQTAGTELTEESESSDSQIQPATEEAVTTAPPAVENSGTFKERKTNPNCPEPLSDSEFDKLYSSVKSKKDDEDRIYFLMKQAPSHCYTTQQTYFLAREVQAESMRYSFLKKAYRQITDPYNFAQLEDHLFHTLEWKSYFRLIYQQ